MTSINDYRFGFSNGMPFWVIGSDARYGTSSSAPALDPAVKAARPASAPSNAPRLLKTCTPVATPR